LAGHYHAFVGSVKLDFFSRGVPPWAPDVALAGPPTNGSPYNFLKQEPDLNEQFALSLFSSKIHPILNPREHNYK